MAQPTPYSRVFSFTDHEAAAPSEPPPGTYLDGEFDALTVTLAGVLANLLKLQRDDGKLVNGIVTKDAISPAVLEMFAAALNWSPRGEWAPGEAYAASDVISLGTKTLIAVDAHVAGAVFADDEAHWILLFDSAGTIPADGSVTAAKIAAGAVLAEAIGFTALDLTGTIRAQGGLAAGSAPPGSLFHAKAAAGAAYLKVERGTDDAGAVGLQIITPAVTWFAELASGGTSFQLRHGATVRLTVDTRGIANYAGTFRAVTGALPVDGVGCGLHYVGGVGYVTCYDYTGNSWHDLKLRGDDVFLVAAGVEVVKVTSTGVEITGTAKLNGSAMGYLGIPKNAQSAAYTLAASDAGKAIYSENVAGQTITVPHFDTVPFGTDATISIINDGAGAIDITAPAGVTLRLVGSAATGDRTLGAGGVATLTCVKQNRWFVGGVGVA